MRTKKNPYLFTDSLKTGRNIIKEQFLKRLEYDLAKDKSNVKPKDVLEAISLAVRDKMIGNWLLTRHKYSSNKAKKVSYLSLEFLMGRLLGNTLINLDVYDECKDMLSEIGYNIDDVLEIEPDMGLGNGGLGRLASCFLDSLATLELPAFGYGIRYEYGIFEQEIENGYQVEKPDNWMMYGNPWEVMRPEHTYKIKFRGQANTSAEKNGKIKFDWENADEVLAVAYDIPIPGYKNDTVNTLRLWQAKSTNEFNLDYFNQGNYLSAVENKSVSEIISKVLYPNDSVPSGKELRFKQQYFFVSATLQDIIKAYKDNNKDFSGFTDKVTIHLNDTHPAIAIPELMRLLMDEEKFEWDNAWEITRKTFAYTNHTILPEALEEWPESLIGSLLPRHLQIINEINNRFLEEVRANYTTDENILSRLSIVQKENGSMIRMSNLAIIGSYSVNGVAELHTDILKNFTFRHFNEVEPGKFNNKTNGITQRRFLKLANPLLSDLITDRIGNKWITNLNELKKIEKYIAEEDFTSSWDNIKNANKERLISFIEENYPVKLNLYSIFDSQIKRFHEYKRQLLNVLHTITLYNKLKENPNEKNVPRTIIFSGKAAPSYFTAKLIIKLINSVANIVNNDKDIGEKLKVIFIKNYSVSLAEKIIPASDLSEQISTAGFEASGTGNMKFALNGALTIGTLDGANIEIKNEVGDDNIYIFGLKAEEIRNIRSKEYNPREYYEKNNELKKVIDMINNNYFNIDEPGIFKPIIEELLYRDYYLIMADYESYINTQNKVEADYLNRELWLKKSIINTARMGRFSSDRTIKQYAEEIWKIKPVKIE
jgi:starch phosphorylase